MAAGDEKSNRDTAQDSISRIITDNGRFFGVACTAANLVSTGCRRHDSGPLAAAALGRTLVGAALLVALMKDEQSLLLKFSGGGVLGKVIAEAGYDGWVRGYIAEPHAELPLLDGKIDVAGGICGRSGEEQNKGAGVLTVSKSIVSGVSYPGTIPLKNGEIGDDIAWYLTQSEQKPSTIGITVSLLPTGEIAAAGGFLVQALPPVFPAGDHELAALENSIAALPPLSSLLAEKIPPKKILSRIFGEIPHHVTQQKPLFYQCSCNKKKMEQALITLGRKDLLQLAAEQKECEVHCQFCREQYIFTAEDIYGLAYSLPA